MAELEIRFDGDVPGLADRELSLGAFGEALGQLLIAARRTASAIVKSKADPEYGAKGGKLAEGADWLDLRITKIIGNSIEPTLRIAIDAPSGKSGLLSLDVQVAEALIDGIEAESRGQARSQPARRYLQLLPRGLRSHRYRATHRGAVLRETTITSMNLSLEEAPTPNLVEVSALVAGLTFEPTFEVRLLAVDGTRYACVASREHVDRAVRLRSKAVRAWIVTTTPQRLIRLTAASTRRRVAGPDARLDRIIKDWAVTLAELAK